MCVCDLPSVSEVLRRESLFFIILRLYSPFCSIAFFVCQDKEWHISAKVQKMVQICTMRKPVVVSFKLHNQSRKPSLRRPHP